MFKKILPILLILLGNAAVLSGQQIPAGWASTGSGTTGGQGGETVTVTSRAELVQYVSADEPYVIRVRDTINLVLYERIKVKGNKTIIGITVNAMLRYGGLEIVGNNVIIRNLIIRDSYDGDWDGKTHSTDAITIMAENVWVDHCWLAASADGLLDVRSNGSNEIGDRVTVSFTRFSDHNKVSLIGSSDDSTEDRDHLRTTFHHCWFDGTLDKGLNQRLPRIRFGDIHLFNNYFEDVASYCILARFESDVVVENNYYRNSKNPHGLDDFGKGIKDPELVAAGNIYEFSGGDQNTSGDAFDPSAFYEYELLNARSVPALVMNEAGPFNDPANRDPVAVIDEVFLAEGERSLDLEPTLNDTDEDNDGLRIGAVINEFQGVALVRNNSLRYVAPSSPEKPDTILYEVVDTRGGYDVGMIIINFEGLVNTAFEPLELEGLSIFPNPAREEIRISFLASDPGNYALQVTDLYGRKLKRQVLQEWGAGKQFFRLPTGDLPSGFYLLSIIHQNSILTKKILVDY